MYDRRREIRYTVPEIYRFYFIFKIKTGDSFTSSALLDFSRHGIKLKSPIRIESDSILECKISVPASLKKEIDFKIKVKYCSADDTTNDFIIGGEIVEIQDELWFNVFEKVHDFIRDRIGEVF